MPSGRYFEDFETSATLRHWPGKTVTEYDHHLFCLLTMHCHPLHLDHHYAQSATRWQRPLVTSAYVFSLLCGLSARDITGQAITHLSFGSFCHPAPVFHGDTLYAQTRVLTMRDPSPSKRGGEVHAETSGHKQDGTLVYSFTRRLIVNKRCPARPATEPRAAAEPDR
ncbi:(R)-specific enoyl-CoA hydratase (plasmid) [Streptomyces sp. YIM 121038]|uniref:MaoC family dehydratase n=1 Tax=Streptomyces sp. YIM 121038 TaxID=2136401 RepID=UPI001110701E|nr:MaoC family dehydratase [Streptomyces sp. YIM 121038]QCX82925.1 (R)-specific enoyl-CoA hydratase [Streptomyces sp. YIM 121038]